MISSFAYRKLRRFSQYFKANLRAVIYLLRLNLFFCIKAACCNNRRGNFSPQKNSILEYQYSGFVFTKHCKYKVSLEINLIELNNTPKITKWKRVKTHLVKADKQYTFFYKQSKI